MKSWLVKLIGLGLFLLVSTAQAADVTIEVARDITLGGAEYSRLIYISANITANDKAKFPGSLQAVMAGGQDRLWNIAVRGADVAGRSFCTRLEKQQYPQIVDRDFRSLILLGDSRNWAMKEPFTEQGLRQDLESKGHKIRDIRTMGKDFIKNIRNFDGIVDWMGKCDQQIKWEQLQKWDQLLESLQVVSPPPTPEDSIVQLEEKLNVLQQINQQLNTRIKDLEAYSTELRAYYDREKAERERLQSEVNHGNFFKGIITTIKDNTWLLSLLSFIVLLMAVALLYWLYRNFIKPWLLHKRRDSNLIESKTRHEQPSRHEQPRTSLAATSSDSTMINRDVLARMNEINENIKNAISELDFYRDRAKKFGQAIVDSFGKKDFGNFLLRMQGALVNFQELNTDLAHVRRQYFSDESSQQGVGSNVTVYKDKLESMRKQCEALQDVYKDQQRSQNEGDVGERMQINKFSNSLAEGLPALNETAELIKNALKNSKETIAKLLDQIREYRTHEEQLQNDNRSFKNTINNLKDEKQRLSEDLSKRDTELTSARKDPMLRDGFIVEGEQEEDVQQAWENYRDDKDGVQDSIDLSRRFKSLREFLEAYPSKSADYYTACGIDANILKWLQDKKSQHQIFWQDRKEHLLESLQGNWKEYWWKIFRTVLLLETYWPDADPKLYRELKYTCDVIRPILGKQGIETHALGLLDQFKPSEKIEDDSSQPLNENLRSNPRFCDRVKPRMEKDRTYCDVSYWGYDIDGVLMEKSHLIVKAPNEGW